MHACRIEPRRSFPAARFAASEHGSRMRMKSGSEETRAAETLPRMKDRDGGRTKGIVIQGQVSKTENDIACFERELVSLIWWQWQHNRLPCAREQAANECGEPGQYLLQSINADRRVRTTFPCRFKEDKSVFSGRGRGPCFLSKRYGSRRAPRCH